MWSYFDTRYILNIHFWQRDMRFRWECIEMHQFTRIAMTYCTCHFWTRKHFLNDCFTSSQKQLCWMEENLGWQVYWGYVQQPAPNILLVYTLSTKTTTSHKLENREIIKFGSKSVSKHCASFGKIFFLQKILRFLNDHISKAKNRKINFSFASAHCASFKKIKPFLRGGKRCLRIVNWE